MAYSPQGEQGLTRAQVRPSSSPENVASARERSQYFLDEILGLFTKGRTPFQNVEREKDRRAKLGLDPDYYDDAFADFAAPQNTVGRQERINSRLEQIEQSKLPPTAPQSFDNTLEGQYQRYFQTPEFNNVFGAGSRGKGAPQDASAMEELGNQLRAPETDTNIASMYASQSALGRVNQDEIQNMYAGDKNMQAWAKANPMLAQREYLKAEQRRANEIGNERERVQLDNPMGKEAYDLIKEQLLNKAAAQ